MQFPVQSAKQFLLSHAFNTPDYPFSLTQDALQFFPEEEIAEKSKSELFSSYS